MASSLLDDPGMDAGLEGERCVRVAQVVEANLRKAWRSTKSGIILRTLPVN